MINSDISNQLKKIRDDAEAKNKKLKREIKEFSSTASLEAIARNNLKMAGEDEVLIIINDIIIYIRYI